MRRYFTKPLTTTALGDSIKAGLLLATLLLGACETGGPTKPDPVTPRETNETGVISPAEPIEPLPNLPASEFSEQFSAAELHLQTFDWMSAQITLDALRPVYKSDADGHYLNYMDARIRYIRGDLDGAESTLATLLQQPLQPALDRRIRNFQRYMDRLAGRYLASARAGDRLLKATPPGAEADALKREIWHDLQRLPDGEWIAEDDAGIDPQWLAWLELTQICAAPSSPAQRRQALALWRSNNPNHPAAQVLPGGLDYLLASAPHAKRIALIMPLSGKLATAAYAIRDGFLAAYYTSRASGGAHFDIDVIDSLQYPSATAAYQSAVAAGATMVVGPLGKLAVKEIGDMSDRPVPVLALNRAKTTSHSGTTAMVQLALSPEDEAKQIATVAYGQGARSAIVLRPASQWGDKMYRAFSEQWRSLGGTVASDAAYSGQQDYSLSVSNALGLPASEQRAKSIRAMLGESVEFSPRRRQDVDAVFLLARKPAEARAIKPLLAYHYASAIPVYATSAIYRGLPNTRDKDLNGITLLEIPWILGGDRATAPVRDQFEQDRYARLHALGADAFLVQSNFARLQAGQDALIRGSTGLLSLTPELQLQRELATATFDRGLLVAQ